MLNEKGVQDAQGRIDLMNRTAPAFFATLKDILLFDVVLRICHLSDPSDTRVKGGESRENLSLENAYQTRRSLTTSESANKAKLALDEFKQHVRPLKALRDRKIAHADKASLGEGFGVRDTDVDRTIEAAIRTMDALDPRSTSVEYGYEGMIAFGDGDSLLSYLRLGDQAHRDRFKAPK
jgi:hypothetical protein